MHELTPKRYQPPQLLCSWCWHCPCSCLGRKRHASFAREVVIMMSPIAQPTLPIANFLTDEEKWFSDREREKKRLTRTSPTTPPPPIGDAVADLWFR